MLILKIPQGLIENCYLSIPGWDYLNGGNGLCRDSIRAMKDSHAPRDEKGNLKLPYRSYNESCFVLPYDVHLRSLKLKSDDPWLLVGARNLGNNLRIVGYKNDKAENQRLFQLNGENADKNESLEYSCLCMKDGRLSIEKVKFIGGKPNQDGLTWAVSGQELVWDGNPVKSDLDIETRIVPFTYDLRHVWRTKGVSEIEQDPEWMPIMADCFVENLGKTPTELTQALKLLIEEKGFDFQRECHYLHNAIGISRTGEVIIVQRHGKLEDVARTLCDAGSYRAIELDQGGSCSVMLGGTDEFKPGRIIFASHYFRPRGIALLVFKLNQLKITEDKGLLASD